MQSGLRSETTQNGPWACHFLAWHHQITSRLSFTWLYLDSCSQKMCIAFCLTTDLQLLSQDLLCWRVSNLSYMACSWVAEQAHHNQNFAADTVSLDSPFPQRSHYKPLAPSESNEIWEELLTHACKPKPHAALWRVPRRHIPDRYVKGAIHHWCME